MMTILLDAAPLGGGVGLSAGAAFFLIFAAIAFLAFKALKKTVKMAFRMVIVAFILVIAIVGSIAFYFLGTGSPSRPERPRQTQSK